MANIPTWYKIRHDFYKQIYDQVSRRMGDEPEEIRKYRKKYEKEFDKTWSISDRKTLFEQINSSQLIYLGDFHPLVQSQKAHLRILKSAEIPQNTILAMECFWFEDQEYIDQYIEGGISERELLKKVEWKKYWGFPWENYQPLLKWARQKKVRIIGLNGPKKIGLFDDKQQNRLKLKNRDQCAADIIAHQIQTSVGCKIFVIFGDLHLADSHLPALVRKKIGIVQKIRSLRVMQNSEKIYFQLLRKGQEDQTDVVKLPKNTFCLLSVPPWVKWQNYLLDIEKTDDKEINEESASDLTDHVSQYVKMISEDLKIKVDLSHLSVFTAKDRSLWKLIQTHFADEQIALIELMIEEERPFFLPQIEVAYLSRMSVNHGAALAMHYIHSQYCGFKEWNLKLPDDFQRLIWLEALSYFGSKLVNPKRKTETLLDLKKMLSSKSPQDSGKEALKLALSQRMGELAFLTHRNKLRFNFLPRREKSYITAATMLGGMMGEKIFTGFRNKTISVFTLQNLLRKDWTSASFVNSYYEILEILETVPASFYSSKTDKL